MAKFEILLTIVDKDTGVLNARNLMPVENLPLKNNLRVGMT
jgi:hypothetical protein